MPHMLNLPIASRIKHSGCKALVTVVGGFNDPLCMAQAIKRGDTDFVAVLRQLTADPRFPEKIRDGRVAQVRPCLRCMRCFPGAYEEVCADERRYGIPYFDLAEHCSVNPEYYRFGTLSVKKAARARRILVVGGGAAGMQAAITAAARGHSVTLIERADGLGGVLRLFAHDAEKHDLWRLSAAMEAELRSSNVQIMTQTTLNRDLMCSLSPDVLIAAVGAEPITATIPGLNEPEVRLADELYTRKLPVDGKLVIIGGGMVGCEVALKLKELGAQDVTLVEMADTLAKDAYRQYGIDLRKRVKQAACCLTGVKCVGISGGRVTIETSHGKKELPATLVINAIGRKAADISALEALAQEQGCALLSIGDCVRARNLCDAIEDGYRAANSL